MSIGPYKGEVMLKTLCREDVLSILPNRDPFAHKGKFGKILLLCGSEGYTGAAALASMGALRSGAGLVFLGVPRSIYAAEAVKLTEAMSSPFRRKTVNSAVQLSRKFWRVYPKWMRC